MSLHNYLSQPIFVTGLPRSGTSMVAGCLHHCGVWVGNTVAGGEGNPKGFYENIRLREQLVKPLLSQFGCDPLGVKSLPEFQQLPRVRGLHRGFVHLLTQDGYQGDQPWMFKDAKLTLLWPLIANVFPLARWVIVRREPEAIVQSCMRTHFMAHHSPSTDFWWDFVRQYQQRLLALKSSPNKVFELSADSLIRGNSEEFLTLADALQLSVNLSDIEGFVAPELWKKCASA